MVTGGTVVIVRYNQVAVGSVNSNRRHFEIALKDIPAINSLFDGMLEEIITHCFKLEDYEKIFTSSDLKQIKTMTELLPL